ncbi:MAG: hypothetical protein M1826_007159 [Phylliscum demangeonii]|nr:MAG: hypothetical protein M1826_007159 [Phylliscum demangeonii]
MASKAAEEALRLKDEGNKSFQAGHYQAAEHLYTQAITLDPANAALYTNRAYMRVKLEAWDGVVSDSLQSIELRPANMKAYYYLAQAQMALHHPNEALSSALTAYDHCLATGNGSVSSIAALVLQAKKAKWEARERERLRRQSSLLRELEDRLADARADERDAIEAKRAAGRLSWPDAREELDVVDEGARAKLDELRRVFALAKPDVLQPRACSPIRVACGAIVPDHLIDSISFSIMHDPVVTKTGQSYDRSTILEHLKRSATDPLTRDPLRHEDLRPNLALKQACADFLEANGWAVDW